MSYVMRIHHTTRAHTLGGCCGEPLDKLQRQSRLEEDPSLVTCNACKKSLGLTVANPSTRRAAERRILEGYADLLNRRVTVENKLLSAAKSGRGLSADGCRELAVMLGTPTEFQHSAASAAGQQP